MNCEIDLGSITDIQYINKNYVNRVTTNWPASDLVANIDLVGGYSWETLDFLPESASLDIADRALPSSQHQYTLKCDIGGFKSSVNSLLKVLTFGKYLVKASDANGNTWLFGNHKVGGKFTQTSRKVGETLPDDNSTILVYTILDRIPAQRIV